MKKFVSGILTFVVIAWPALSFSAGSQVDALIEKLVDKGILDKKEARELKSELASDEKMFREEAFKTSLPEWVQKMKLKGDFRLRYQYERDKNTDQDARERGRIRYRLGVETGINKQVKVGAGLSSGGSQAVGANTTSDPRSTNQSFQNTFERPDLRLDYAYAEYTPNEMAKLIGGIFPRSNYLWTPTDMLWDGDINPQGGAIHLEKKAGSFTPYVNTGVLVIDEVSSTTNDRPDPYLVYTQGGLKWKNDIFDANLAGIFYSFNAIKGTCPDWSAGSNTGITTSSNGNCSSGALRYDYDSLGASAEVGVSNPFNLNLVERLGVFADFIYNVDGDADGMSSEVPEASGLALGLVFGDKSVSSFGRWQAKYIYVNLGRDAFVDFTPDSDRYGGRTGTQSHEGILEFGLTKNVTLGLDYYYSKLLFGNENPEHIFQGDIVFKF